MFKKEKLRFIQTSNPVTMFSQRQIDEASVLGKEPEMKDGKATKLPMILDMEDVLSAHEYRSLINKDDYGKTIITSATTCNDVMIDINYPVFINHFMMYQYYSIPFWKRLFINKQKYLYGYRTTH